MASSEKHQSVSTVFSAFSAFLGAIGAAAITRHTLERLLWPQRNIANATIRDYLTLALLDPMGGPLYAASLAALDEFHAQDLLAGSWQGDILGTAFFRDEPFTVKTHNASKPGEARSFPIRNCLWLRAVRQACRRIQGITDLPTVFHEKREASEVMRVRSSVSHLTLRRAPADSRSPIAVEHPWGITVPAVLGIFAAETTALCVVAVVAAVWRSWWAFWWTVPLLLRLLSLICQLPRESLADSSAADNEHECDYEIATGPSSTSLLLMTGCPAVVSQFFRHYGHPRRNRILEIVQITIIVAFGLYFPIGLLSSGLWMPNDIQYVWTAYQIYVSLAMYVARYSSGHETATTEARLATYLSKTASGGNVVLGRGPNAVATTLEITWHSRRQEAQQHMVDLLERRSQVEEAVKTSGQL